MKIDHSLNRSLPTDQIYINSSIDRYSISANFKKSSDRKKVKKLKKRVERRE